MPVHLAFDRHRAGLDPPTVLLIDRLLDSKGCRHPSVFHRHEPVCCCERCYAFLANPIIAKLASAEDGPWSSDETALLAPGDDVVMTGEWFSLCPWSAAACDCDRSEKDSRRSICDDVKERSKEETSAPDESPLTKKRLTNDKATATDCDPFITGARRPLVDLQRGVYPRAPWDSTVNRSDTSFHPAARSAGTTGGGGGWARDEARSWVQPPPNRTICHIVDDLTLERLTAAASPVMTRCCVASSSAARKQQGAPGRNVGAGGKTKAKNQCMAR